MRHNWLAVKNPHLNVVTGAFGYTGRAIARKLLAAGHEVRTITGHPGPCAEDSIKSLNAHLSSYLNGGRSLFLELEEQIKGNCDIILDGRLRVDELAATIYMRLRQQQSA